MVLSQEYRGGSYRRRSGVRVLSGSQQQTEVGLGSIQRVDEGCVQSRLWLLGRLAASRHGLCGALVIIGLVLLLWISAFLPLPFSVGIGRPLRMRFEYRVVELRLVVDCDASSREVWVWIPFLGWEKRWSETCAVPDAADFVGKWAAVPGRRPPFSC